MHAVSEIETVQGYIDGALALKDPVENYANNSRNAKVRNANHHFVMATLKKASEGSSVDWSTRDEVSAVLTGKDLRLRRNFWAHAAVQTRNGVNILFLPKSPIYPDGIPMANVVQTGLDFIDYLQPYRGYLTTQYTNVLGYLKVQADLLNEYKKKDTA